ncbi:MAG: substrate-binding domain-containing protein [Desulfobaccales bacterium]
MPREPHVKKVLGWLIGLLLSFSLALFPAAVRADILEIPGTGACEVLLQALAAAFNATHTDQVVVPPTIGSIGGIRRVAADRAILARVAQPLREQEKASGLQYLVFARDMVVFVGGARVTAKNLTQGQLLEVYAGKIADWQELGGDPGPIRLLVRQPGDSNLRVIHEYLPLFRNLTFPLSAKVIHTDPKMLEMLQKYKYSLGWAPFSSLKSMHPPLKALALDGIAPTPENARSHKYPIICDYALVFKEKRLNNLARSFIDFIFSKQAQQVMNQYGAMPVDKE